MPRRSAPDDAFADGNIHVSGAGLAGLLPRFALAYPLDSVLAGDKLDEGIGHFDRLDGGDQLLARLR